MAKGERNLSISTQFGIFSANCNRNPIVTNPLCARSHKSYIRYQVARGVLCKYEIYKTTPKSHITYVMALWEGPYTWDYMDYLTVAMYGTCKE